MCKGKGLQEMLCVNRSWFTNKTFSVQASNWKESLPTTRIAAVTRTWGH